jgi:flagellar motor protein MotB
MGDQPQKTGVKSPSEATKKIKNAVPAMQVVLETEPLALFPDPMTLQRAMVNPGGLPPTAIPGLQRAVGNQHVQTMLTCAEPAAGIAAQIQKQAIVGYAQQRAAPDGASVEVTQRQPDADGGVELSDPVTDEINRGISRGGSSLPKDTQVKMKHNLGIANPEEIQVHTGQQADTLGKALGARAFTTGSHIFFRQGEYDPGSTKGQALLYHESVHTVQQGGVKGNAPQAKMVVNPPDDRYEQEAEAVAGQAVLAPEPIQPQFVEPGPAPKTTPHVSQKDDEESDQGAVPTMSYVQMAEEKKEEKEESKEEEKEAKEKEKEEKEREKEAEEKGKEKEQEAKESGEEKKEASKSKAKDKGKAAGQPKEKPPPPQIPGAAEFTPPEPKVDPSVVDDLDGDTATEVKFDPDAFEFEEPEQQPLLPTWDQLAEGTVQLSMEEVQEEYRIRLSLADSDPADFESIDDPTQGFNVEPGEPAEPTKSGADLVGEAFAQGALAGFTEGAQSWATDTALEMATSKIKYADGLINLCKLAYDPKAWVQDNVFAVGDSFMAVGSAFKDIGSEKTPFGVIAATLEAAIAIIDFINSIIGLINQILTMLLWILRALLTVSNVMIGLAPTVIVIVLVPVFPFAWTPAVFSPIASFCSFAISWLDPLNTVVGQVGTVLNLVKLQLQPFAIMFRMLDMLTYQGDPEEMEKKQAKLQGNIKGFVQSTTTSALDNAKDKAVDGINKRRDQSKVKKLEDQAKTGDSPDLQARIAAKKDEFKEKYGESVEDFRGKSKKQTAKEMAKAAAAAPAAAIGKAFGVKREEGEWKAAGIYGGVAEVKKKGFKEAVKAGAKSLATTFKERRREVQQALRKEQAAVREKVQKRAGESAEKIGRKTGAARPEEVPGLAAVPVVVPPAGVTLMPYKKTSLGEIKGKAEEATKTTEKWVGEPKKTKAQGEAETERTKHLTAQQQAEADAKHKRQQAQDARDAARADEVQAGEHQKKAQEAAEAKRKHEEDAEKFGKQAADAQSSAETQRKKAAEEEKTQKRLEKEAGESEAAAKKGRDKASQSSKEAGDAEKQASAAKKEAEGKQQELGNAQEKAKAANQDLEEAKRKQQEMQEKCDKALQGPGGMDTGKSRALRNLELAERRLTEAQTKADAANERVAKARSELDEANTRRQKAETEARQKREVADKAQREADRLQTEAGKKKTEAQEAGKRKADNLKEAGKFDEVAKQKRAAAKKAQDDADEAERQRKHHEDETDRLVGVAKNKREEADLYDEAAEKFEFTAKKEGYRARPPEEDEDLDDWIDKVSKWKGEPVFGGQRHGPGIIGTNLIYWLMQTPWADEEYEEARAKTDQAIALKNAGQYQQALDIVKGLNAESWQKKADSLKELLGPRGWRNETIANFETLANDIRSFYVYDPSNPPPSAGQRLKLQLNTLTPGLPPGAVRVNGGETAFVVTVIERVGGDVNTPVTDEITDFPQGTDKVEKDYYSLLPASQRPISLAVRPKPVTFEANDVERTYTPKYRKVNKSLQSGVTLYDVWIGYESSLSFTSTAVTSATSGQGYRYDITATGGEGGDLTITAPTRPAWLSLTDNGDGTATLTGTPADANVGDHDVKLKVEGEGGFFATQSFKLTVRAMPRFTSTPVTMVYRDDNYSYSISATDPDTAGSQLAITALTKPGWLSLTDNGDGTATLTGTPTAAQVGAHSVELKVEDDYGYTAAQSFTVTVSEPVQPKRAESAGTAVQRKMAVVQRRPDPDEGQALIRGDREVPQAKGIPMAGEGPEAVVQEDLAVIQRQPDPGGAGIAGQDTRAIREEEAPISGEDTRAAVWEKLAVLQRQPGPAIAGRDAEAVEGEETLMAGEEPGAAVEEDSVLQRQPDFGMALTRPDTGAIEEEKAPIAGEEPGAAIENDLGLLQRQPDLSGPATTGPDVEAAEGPGTLIAGEDVEATEAVHQEEESLEVIPAPQSLVVQLQTEGEEEEDEEAFISDSDIAYQKSLAARASLLEMAPEPPENMIERIQGAALAYEAVDAEEYDLALQQQQIGGMIEHGQGQMVELEGARQMTAVNKQGVAAQIQDAETQMQAQDQMQSQLASQEGQTQQTAKQGDEGQNVMSQIFGKIMSAFGMGSSQGAGDNGAQGQSGAMKSGVQDTSKTTGATAGATKTGQQSVASSKARTMKVQEGAKSAQDDLNQLDDKLASDMAGNQEGLDELGEAAAANEESLATVQGEKERLRDEHTSATSIAEMWAEEHRFVREQVFSQLESELA